MNKEKHVILGANGIAGKELYNALGDHPGQIRRVNRSQGNDRGVYVANLLDKKQTIDAVEGYDVVYLTVGVPYNTDIWKKEWPLIIENVVDGTLAAGARLVFLDNVYMYGKVDGWMTEETVFNPISKKGEVRARVAEHVLHAIEHRGLTALIARSADFLGFTDFSLLKVLVFDKLNANERPVIFGASDKRHSFTYTRDIGAALASLAKDKRNFGQTWHLPTHPNVLTNAQLAEQVQLALGKEPTAPLVLKREDLSLIAPQDEFIDAYMEMLYQMENDYLFSSKKFEEAFQKNATPYLEAIKDLAGIYKKNTDI